MKLKYPLTLLLSILLFLTSCHKSEEDEIEAVTKDFAEAFYNFDFDEASEYVTPQSHIFISLYASNIPSEDIAKQRKAGKSEAEIIKVILSKNGTTTTATVKCKITNHLKLDFLEGTSTIEKVSDKNFDLIKSNNEWLINLHP